MSNALEVILEKDVTNDPSKLAQMIAKISNDINSCKNDLSELKDRGFLDRLFSNNTRDVANVMLKQNDTISLFMGIVQSIIMLHMHNVVMLSQIQEKLGIEMRERGLDTNRYTKMARDFIAQSYSTALAFKNKIDESVESVEYIKKQLIHKHEIDEEQSRLIDFLNQKLTENNNLDEEQSKLIEGLNSQVTNHRDALNAIAKYLKQKEELDASQSDLISRQESSMVALEGINAGYSQRFDILAGDIAEIKSAYEAKIRNAYIAVATSLVIAVSVLIITFFR